MRLTATPAVVAVLVLAATGAAPRTGAAFDASWDASSGALPDSACPAWRGTTNDTLPVVANGLLHVGTSACTKNTFWQQSGSQLQMPESLVVDARLRFGSGTECVGPCGHYRQAAAIVLTTAPQVGTQFFVGNNEVFLTNGVCNGIVSASVPTTGSAHTYRLVVTAGQTVSVFYDGAPLLSGQTFASAADFGDSVRILWGEGSSFAYGTSDWEFVRHNAHAVGCASTRVGETRDGAGAPGSTTLRAVPNPSRRQTSLSYSVPTPSHVRIDVYGPSGRWIRRVLDAASPAGEHRATWDGLDEHGVAVRPGEYLYRVIASDGARTGRILRLP